jgi:hypothetical protein
MIRLSIILSLLASPALACTPQLNRALAFAVQSGDAATIAGVQTAMATHCRPADPYLQQRFDAINERMHRQLQTEALQGIEHNTRPRRW